METINQRIDFLIKNLKLTKTKFAEPLNLSSQFVSSICSGAKQPSDRTIADICREFNVNETWLRTGEGEMMKELTQNQEIAEFLGKVMNDPDDAARKRFISIVSQLGVKEWEILAEIAEKWAQGK
jgi:transcriptional regulator with XRE-family HTH domain